MPNFLEPRSCGPYAWLRWTLAAARLMPRVSWELWLAFIALTLAGGWAMSQWPSAWPAAVAYAMALRGSGWSLGSLLLTTPTPGSSDQWKALAQGWPSWGWVAVGVTTVIGWAWGALQGGEERFVSSSDGAALRGWALAVWAGWGVRPWGPVGFVGPLERLGCPWATAFGLQARAATLNPVSLACLGVFWLALFAPLLAWPLLAVAGGVAWPLLLRCAFADVFEHSLEVPAAQTAPSGAGASQWAAP